MCYKMNIKILKQLIYTLVTMTIVIIIYFSPLNNSWIYSLLFLSFTIYLGLNYFNDLTYDYLSQIYLLWLLVAIVYNFFAFSFFSIILSISCLIILIIQYFVKNKAKKKTLTVPSIDSLSKKEIVEPKKKEVKKKNNAVNDELLQKQIQNMYLDVQKAFMNFDYDELKKLLSTSLYQQFEHQMNHLANNNRCAIRDNIVFFNYEVMDKTPNNIRVKIGIYEDKYTKREDDVFKPKGIRYESYYELNILLKEQMVFDSINLLYSHSYKQK